MANSERFYHSSFSGNLFNSMLSRSFLVRQIVLTTRDFEEWMQPPFQLEEISEEELDQYDSKKMAIKGQICRISKNRWMTSYKTLTPYQLKFHNFHPIVLRTLKRINNLKEFRRL